MTASDTVPALGQAAGLDVVAFPDTVSPGLAYPQGGALAATVNHLYTFDASDTVSGTYALTVTDRAANETTVPFQVVRDAISPTVFLTVPARSVSTTIPVQWSATDGESGVRDYDVWYKVDEGEWVLWLNDTQSTQDTFDGDLGHTYTFRVQATDRVSNASAPVTATVKTVVVKKYYHLAGQRVAMRANGVVYWLHGDHLGSTSLTTDVAGNVVAEQRYYPYGEPRWVSGTLPTDFTFTGQRDEDFGLYDYHARYYSSRLGRFISADAIVPGVGSQAHNRYMYVTGNPLKYSDPSGYFTEKQIKGFFGVDTWDEVLSFFEEGGELEGLWGYLQCLRGANVDDMFTLGPDPDGGPYTPYYVGTFKIQDDQLFLDNRPHDEVLKEYLENNPEHDHFQLFYPVFMPPTEVGTWGFESVPIPLKRDPVISIRWMADEVDWIAAGLNVLGIAVSPYEPNTLPWAVGIGSDIVSINRTVDKMEAGEAGIFDLIVDFAGIVPVFGIIPDTIGLLTNVGGGLSYGP